MKTVGDIKKKPFRESENGQFSVGFFKIAGQPFILRLLFLRIRFTSDKRQLLTRDAFKSDEIFFFRPGLM